MGEYVKSSLASPGGKLARPVRGVTEEGWRQPKYCLHLVRWYQSKIIADYFPLFRFIYHMENGFYKTSPLLHSPNPSSNFRCTPSLISLFWQSVPKCRLPKNPASPRGKPRGAVRIRLRFYKAASAYRETPQSGPLGLPAPLSGALFSLPPLGEVPRSGKGGDVGWLRAVHVTT